MDIRSGVGERIADGEVVGMSYVSTDLENASGFLVFVRVV